MTPVLIVLIVFGFVATVIKLNLDFKRDKMLSGGGEGGESGLRMSELKALIQEAVEAANEPLRAQLDDVTEQLDALQNQLPSAERPQLPQAESDVSQPA